MLLWFLFVNLIAVTYSIGEECQTPLGQRGVCVSLASCKHLMWSFANPKAGIVEYLQKFLCSNETEQGIFVCCRTTSDTLVFEDEEDTWNPDPIHNIKNLVNEHTCGVPNNNVPSDGLISLYNFPWLVKILSYDFQLYLDSKGIYKIGCTGVLITNRYVLYTAECYNSFGEEQMYVIVDFYNESSTDCLQASSSYTKECSTFETFEIEHNALHPFYDPITKINNLAIMRLERAVKFSDSINQICLPLIFNLPDHGLVHTSGWNRTTRNEDSSVKKTYTSVAISNFDCKRAYTFDDVLTAYDTCTTHGMPPKDESIGYPVTMLYEGRWYILGFTSRGKEPRIHSRVQNYLQWIKESLGGERCLTPHNEMGECIQITECSRLRGLFANVGPQELDYLNKFVCDNPLSEKEFIDIPSLKVCCGLNPNFTISENLSVEEPNIYNISDFRFCGLQHRDDYFSTDDNISVDEFPWLAAIINATLPSQRDGVCGGSLISVRYVLTSMGCMNNFQDTDTMLVRLGDYNLKTEVDCFEIPGFDDFECADIQEFEVETRIDHPYHNSYQNIHNLALLRLNKSVVFSDYVRPICLPTSEDDYFRYGETYYVTGYGDNEDAVEGPKTKKKILNTLIPLEVCNELGRLYYDANPTTDYEFCTEDSKNATYITCSGDEGGPVMYSKKFRWFLQGISSTYGCGDGEPQTHIKLIKFLKWIKLNIRDSM